MQRDPSSRLSAETYLRQERGRVFPEVFYSFLQSYTLAFSAAPILSADEKISRYVSEISLNIWINRMTDKIGLSRYEPILLF